MKAVSESRSVNRWSTTFVTGAAAGLAGGVAEVLWVMVYAAASAVQTGAVARGVAAAMLPPSVALGAAGIELGVVIHLLLSVTLGVALLLLLRGLAQFVNVAPSEFAALPGLLAIVWAINFFVVLPSLAPSFPLLMPYAATLTSKLLFGVAAAWVARTHRAVRARSQGAVAIGVSRDVALQQ